MAERMQMKMPRWMRAGLLLTTLLWPACQGEQLPEEALPSRPKGDSAKAAEQEKPKDLFAVQSGKMEYGYNPIGKRDPFMIDISEGEEKLPGNSKLLQYGLDQLKVTAIIWGIAKPRALVSTPDGDSFIVQKGDLMGRNYGKISRVAKDELVVVEEYPGPMGKLIVNEIRLPLEEKAGESPLDLR